MGIVCEMDTSAAIIVYGLPPLLVKVHVSVDTSFVAIYVHNV